MLNGKTVVITGCLQGIGNETLKVFAENGANIFACAYVKDDTFEDQCKALAENNKISIVPLYFDMKDNESIRAAVKTIQESKMEIHGLVNVAGINKDAFFNMISYQDMIETFQVNFYSQIILSQYIVRIMQRKKTPGSIVFTSSVTAIDGNKGQVVYGASKAALIGAMKSMALELGKSGIRVNAVAPGVIRTPMTSALDSDIIKQKIDTTDINRIGEAKEVADTYLFLVSELSKHISGQVFRIDGGIRS